MPDMRLLEIHAREALGMGAAWYAHTFHAERNMADLSQTMYYKVSGCIAPLVTRGPRQGHPNWRKHEKGTERTIYFTPQDQEAWELRWEQDTGHCRACVGEGAVLVRWSVARGTETQPCQACEGTGACTMLTPVAQEENHHG